MPRPRSRCPPGDWFQSTPPVAEGRCAGDVRHDAADLTGFNPRPPLPRGDARCQTTRAPYRLVSIHAPRCRGAMHAEVDRFLVSDKFQSTPPVAEGRCATAQRNRHPLDCFNPRPPLPRGDALAQGANAGRPGRFNPRPPLPRGDAPASLALRANRAVSIHAPRCRGAMPHPPDSGA